jgi:hypothetical protein
MDHSKSLFRPRKGRVSIHIGLALLATLAVLLAPSSVAAQRIDIPVDGGRFVVTNPSFVVQNIKHRPGTDFALVKCMFDLVNESNKEWRWARVNVDLLDASGAVLGKPIRDHSFAFDVPRIREHGHHKFTFEQAVPVARGTQKNDVTISAADVYPCRRPVGRRG